MKSSRKVKAEIAVIGGSGLEKFMKRMKSIRVGTLYGFPSPIFLGELGGRKVAFMPRHGVRHSMPPHKINYRANIHALHELGVKRIIATNAVGAINPSFKLGDLVVPHDFVDFTRFRHATFYDESPVVHVDMTHPYCPELREALIEAAGKCVEVHVRRQAVLVCTEGPRFETPAEIEMFRRLGGDVVGMTGVPEVVLARELEMCYASICYVTNMAAGMQERLTAQEVTETARRAENVLRQVLKDTVRLLPKRRHCPCMDALKEARFRG